MKGLYHFKVTDTTKNLEFDFTLKRNITILQGDSASGKTTLLEMLAGSQTPAKKYLYKVNTNANFYVYLQTSQDRSWLEVLEDKTNMVIFIEENNNFIYDSEFAKYVAESGNYFVIVSRIPIYSLPYSIQEIYSIECNSSNIKHYYYTFKELYHNFPYTDTNFDLIVTEDAKSGYQFFNKFFKSISVISADGNSNVLNTILNSDASNILCIVDGAAFGSLIKACAEYMEYCVDKRITLWLPESFEWVLLKAGVISFGSLAQVLENPSDYIECKDYVSWERFFTHLAEENSNPKWKYTKGELDPYYYTEKNQEKVKSVMPKELQSIEKDKMSNGVKIMSLF